MNVNAVQARKLRFVVTDTSIHLVGGETKTLNRSWWKANTKSVENMFSNYKRIEFFETQSVPVFLNIFYLCVYELGKVPTPLQFMKRYEEIYAYEQGGFLYWKPSVSHGKIVKFSREALRSRLTRVYSGLYREVWLLHKLAERNPTWNIEKDTYRDQVDKADISINGVDIAIFDGTPRSKTQRLFKKKEEQLEVVIQPERFENNKLAVYSEYDLKKIEKGIVTWQSINHTHM